MLADTIPAATLARVKPLRVAVIGAGYVGLVSGACLAELGHRVVIVEIDEHRLRSLRSGLLPIREAGLDELADRQVTAGRLQYTDQHDLAVRDADVVMVAVSTPSDTSGRVDLRAVEAVIRQVAPLAPGALTAIKSTVPPGTAMRMERIAHDLGATGVRVVSNPEFLREGRAVHDFMVPDRVVIGARAEGDGDLVARLYEPLDATVYRCLPEEAELAKYAANSLLAARISFMNEMSGIADQVGADIARVSTIVGSDSRIGPAFLNAGLGWGGSCFPKDVHGLASVAADLGLAAPMLNATIEANRRQRERALGVVMELLAGIPSPRVGLLGLAFKPHTDDVRESPALWLARALVDRGVMVRAADPWALTNAERGGTRMTYALDPLHAAEGAHVTILATEWPEFVALDWAEVARRMRGDTVLDARNALDAAAVRGAGLTYRSLGRDVLGRDPVDGDQQGARPCAS